MLSLTNAFFWIGFSPIEPLVRTFYNVGATEVNCLSAMFMVLYVPGAVLSSYLLYAKDLRVNILVASLLMAAGGWLRYSSIFIQSSNPWYAFGALALGQSLAGLAQPALTNTPAKLAAEWFPNGERDVATTLASISNIVGNAVGQVVPSVLVNCGTTKGGSCKHGDTVQGMDTLLLAQAALASVLLVWAGCCLQAEPSTAPSASALQRRENRMLVRAHPNLKMSPLAEMRSDVRKLLRNPEFVKILFGFGVGLAYFNAMLTDLSQVEREE